MQGNKNTIIKWLLEQKEDIEFKIEVYKEKRSNNANNYAWALFGKMSAILKISADEVYEEMLKNYGTNVLVNDEIVKITSETELKSSEDLHIAFIGKSDLNGKSFNHYRLIKGSSKYNTKEMATFIDGVVQEAMDLGIQTLDDTKINSMVESWGKK